MYASWTLCSIWTRCCPSHGDLQRSSLPAPVSGAYNHGRNHPSWDGFRDKHHGYPHRIGRPEEARERKFQKQLHSAARPEGRPKSSSVSVQQYAAYAHVVQANTKSRGARHIRAIGPVNDPFVGFATCVATVGGALRRHTRRSPNSSSTSSLATVGAPLSASTPV
jgi:hypothetical protein